MRTKVLIVTAYPKTGCCGYIKGIVVIFAIIILKRPELYTAQDNNSIIKRD
jgi:hypothetical protein